MSINPSADTVLVFLGAQLNLPCYLLPQNTAHYITVAQLTLTHIMQYDKKLTH